jgi:hypothetical protein
MPAFLALAPKSPLWDGITADCIQVEEELAMNIEYTSKSACAMIFMVVSV